MESAKQQLGKDVESQQGSELKFPEKKEGQIRPGSEQIAEHEKSMPEKGEKSRTEMGTKEAKTEETEEQRKRRMQVMPAPGTFIDLINHLTWLFLINLVIFLTWLFFWLFFKLIILFFNFYCFLSGVKGHPPKYGGDLSQVESGAVPKKMKAVLLTSFVSVKNIHVVDIPVNLPTKGQVLIKSHSW